MSKGLRLHREHGVNPTIPLCYICEKPRNEVVLLGAAYKGEAPMHMKMDFEVCDDCQEKYMKTGVLLIEAKLDSDDKPHPTGTFSVIRDEAFTRVFGQDIPPARRVFVEPGVLEKIGAIK